jgi:sarcosine oxidase subunit alpha
MLAGAARTYLHRYGVRAGSRAVVVTATDDAYRAALELHEAGVKIAAIVDLRTSADGALVQAARGAGIEVLARATVLGTRGNLRVASIDIGIFDNGGHVRERRPLSCNLVLMSGGLTPSVHLFSQSRGKLQWQETARTFVPDVSAERERSAGACRGVHGIAAALEGAAGPLRAQACGHQAARALR